MIPLMISDLVFIPNALSVIVLVGLFIVGLKEFRQGYISRIGIFLNAMLLWQIFYSVWNILPPWFQLYMNIGTVIAIIALISYINLIPLPTELYTVCYFAYGSITILILVGLFFSGIPIFGIQPTLQIPFK
jgi:hypothetical protein